MARRRTQDDAPFEDDPSNLFADRLSGGGSGRVDEFGNQVPDFSNDPNFPTPFVDYVPDEIAGNQETARELGDVFRTRSPLAAAPQPEPEPSNGLPMSMTVETGYDDGGQPSVSTPAMPHEPTPIAGMRAAPEIASQGTRRVSSGGAPSALFGDTSTGTPMFGRLGGLEGGGIGAMGLNEGGPTPTQMMLSLLRMMRNGA